MNEAQMKEILEDAKNQLTNNKGILKDSPIIQQFVEARKKIDAAAATKNPLVKEYIDIHKEAEKNTNTMIGRMTRAMKNIAAQHRIYMTAIEMSTDDDEKQRLKEMADELANHPAVASYGKYIEGLRYLSGEIYEVSPDVEKFFREEMRVPLQKHDSKYEVYRLGADEYVERETERLNKLEAELKKKQIELENRQQELEEKSGSQDRKNLLNEKISLENTLKGILGKKEKLMITNTPEVQEKQEEYQKAIAKIKARELFEKQTLMFEALEKDFIGDYRYRKDKAKIAPFRDRQTPTTICIAMMIMEGYKLEEIMDPTALLDKKKEIGQKYIDRRQKGDVKWYVKTMYDGSIAMMNAFKEYVIEHKEELKTEQDLAMHAGTLGVLSQACFDMFQELAVCKRVDNGNLYKTIEEYDILENKICVYECGADLGTTQEVKYDIESLYADAVAKELRRQLSTKMLLDEIQKENPDIDSVLIGAHKTQSLDNQLIGLPEFRMLYGDSTNVSIHKFSKDDFKQLAFMQSRDFIEKNNIRYERVKYPAKVTKDFENIFLDIKEGEKLEYAASSNGKQLVATADIRGKKRDNSAQFNKLLEEYEKVMSNIGYDVSYADKPESVKNLKEAALAYINAKRAQKGYDSKSVPNDTIDAQMLGKEKGGKSIFTERGRDRYEFALEIVTKIMDVEKRYEKDEVQKQDVEIQKDELDAL